MTSLLWMLALHFVCDYPLQGDFLSKGKHPWAGIPGVPWFQCMLAHAFIHAAAVGLVTHSVAFAAAELALHFVIDIAKCHGAFGFNTDQALHVCCKVLWCVIPFLAVPRIVT